MHQLSTTGSPSYWSLIQTMQEITVLRELVNLDAIAKNGEN
ncbi:hypothetical protein SLEP1_g51882 [Rubroshorea leprosula]|uniref:Uncharacterized protein n=1 Tax=Rubroshorea leprosula TaxID=152421 RepID=A0AAV5M4K4_9ROSI|nr:hypothetical protein SLEP1_g51882 [Rubroshorea leprosula]